ncbi:MAG: exonuclease subunit SbcD, partial [Thermoanaerobaculia bacterium]|nr:exonuclease subunit SbcD [Thermoanaerobaculia bacterium]
MRLIHTADWHLGQTFYSHERSLEHQRFLDWLLATLEREQADVLLVAGDVFDTANPSSEAQRQLYGFLSAARRLDPAPQIVLTAGNHDSPRSSRGAVAAAHGDGCHRGRSRPAPRRRRDRSRPADRPVARP